MDYSEKLKILRLQNHKTQSQVAKELGISKTAYSNYENRIRKPNDTIKKKLAYYFNTSVEDIFF